ncbi:flagellar motor protein MotA [Oceanobacillus piezotolerans]|uniref:Flagellar motor protein MotA n=1 Tax=Oceanobacillus piezotolerans TaxID=2448030 RepID=A0A498D8A2_9BACI|nr:flagellar motor stator protein MotA [Oceanobacillus piezotolerans]RLL46935.1 flagellar motor protein MotA [Oceanobacillus piezotolerans]
MDITTLIGLILGFIAIVVGMILKGASLASLINPAALLIIFVGTAAAVSIAFPGSTLKKLPALFKILFSNKSVTDNKELIHLFSRWTELTRREGILSLEGEISDVKDPFLAAGLQMVVDGQSPDYIKEVMLQKIEAMEERHEEGASIFTQAGTYAPTLGVLGAVIGLIAALADMSNIDALGHAISAAFVATLFGIFSGYVLWHPFANKLREKSKKEIQQKELIIEGILSITSGNSTSMIQEKLGSFLTTKEFEKLKQGDYDAQE